MVESNRASVCSRTVAGTTLIWVRYEVPWAKVRVQLAAANCVAIGAGLVRMSAGIG